MIEQDKDLEILSEAASRIEWNTYEEKEILCGDYTNLSGNQFARLVQGLAVHISNAGKSDILLLIDLNNSNMNKESVNACGEAGRRIKPLIKKAAILGITGLKKAILKVVILTTSLEGKTFNTEEEAKDWLVS